MSTYKIVFKREVSQFAHAYVKADSWEDAEQEAERLLDTQPQSIDWESSPYNEGEYVDYILEEEEA